MAFVDVLVAVLLVVLPCVWWLWRSQSSRSTGQKGGRPIPLLPEPRTFFGGHIPWALKEGRKYGGLRFMPHYYAFMKHQLPVYSVQLGPPFKVGPFGHQFIMVNDSAMAEEIIKSKEFGLNSGFSEKLTYMVGGPSVITMDGAEWKYHRRLMQPIFRREQLQSALEIIFRHTNEYLEELHTKPYHSGKSSTQAMPVNLMQILPELAMDIVAEVGYGYNIHNQPPEKKQAIREALPAMLKHFAAVVYQPSLAVYRFWNRKKHLEFLGHHKLIQSELIYQMLKKRRSAMKTDDETPQDLLSLLLSAKDEESTTGHGFTEEEVVNEAMMMFVAGYETTAGSLAWVLYYLAKHPGVQDRVYDEVNKVTSEEDLTSLEGIGKLTYLSWVIKEVQRLQPVAPFMGRGALRDTVVQGYHFPAGTNVTICSYNIHHSPDEWDNPEEFKPDRWEKADGGCKKSVGYSFLAFGAGARRCLGQPLAVPELKLVSALFVSKFHLVLADEDCKPVMPFTYQPSQVLVTLEPR